MKKLFSLFLILFLPFYAYSANQWRAGTGASTIPGGTNISDIDAVSYQNMTDPIDRVLTNFRQGCKIVYLSASTLTVESGEIVVSNSDGSIPLYQSNPSDTTVTWSDIDTGAENDSTTYYVYAYQDTTSTSTFSIKISASSSAPTGVTYYKKLGSFYNNSDSNITDILNDSFFLELGSWTTKSNNVSYQASTDGFVVGWGTSDIDGYTDTSNSPTTQRVGNAGTICMPVKRGNYWKITGASAVYWISNE